MHLSKVILFLLSTVLLFASQDLSAQSKLHKERRALTLEWEPVDGAIGYHVEVRQIKADGTFSKIFRKKTKKSSWVAKAPVGRYQMRIRSYDARRVPGDWSEYLDFVIKPSSVKLYEPKNNQVIRSDQEESEITFKWRPQAGISSYKVILKSGDGSFSKEEVVKESSAKIKLFTGKKYNWQVVSMLNDEIEGDPAKVSFNFEIQHVKHQITKKQEKEESYKSKFYYVASYLII